MASIKIYSKEQTDALLPTSEQLVPSGGSTGQVLTKSASGTEWTTPSAGINVVQSTGSSTSDVMSQKAVTDNLPLSSQLVPSGGTDGQVLTKVSGSPAWANVSGGIDWDELDLSNMPNDFQTGDVLAIRLKVLAYPNTEPSSWSTSISTVGISNHGMNTFASPLLIIKVKASGENTTYDSFLISDINCWANTFINSSTATSMNSGSSYFTISGHAFNRNSSVKASEITVGSSNIATYVYSIYRLKK